MGATLDPLNDIDLSALAAIVTSGKNGLSTEDLGAKIGGRNAIVAVAAFLKRVRKREHDVVTLKIGRRGNANLFRYAMADAVEAEPAPARKPTTPSLCEQFGIRAVQREIRPDPMSSTCTLISVAYVSCLDAAASRALGGEG